MSEKQPKNIYICATMDTKGEEAMYLKRQIEACGNRAYIIDVALRETEKGYPIDYTQEQVAEAASVPFSTIQQTLLRSEASKYMITGLTTLTRRLLREGRLDGIISLGGSGGTTIATGAMQQLPLGIPKVVVGTMASGNTLPYVQGQSRARSLGNMQAVEQAIQVGAPIRYDATAQSPHYNYWRDRAEHEVWFEDARSVRAKLALAGEYQLAGVSIWNIMRYFPQLWLVLNSLYDIEKLG